MTDRPRVRATARVVVLDPAGRVLLFGARLVDLATPPGPVLYWYTPGGAIEHGESIRRAAVRELAEEIGLTVEPESLEGPVWLRRSISLLVGETVDARETYFVLRDVEHEVDGSGRTEQELVDDEPHRWWTLAEIAAGTTAFAPRALADVLPEVLAGPWAGPPRIVD